MTQVSKPFKSLTVNEKAKSLGHLQFSIYIYFDFGDNKSFRNCDKEALISPISVLGLFYIHD